MHRVFCAYLHIEPDHVLKGNGDERAISLSAKAPILAVLRA